MGKMLKKPRRYSGSGLAAPYALPPLPSEIWVRCLQYVHWKDLCAFACVSKRFRELRNNPTVDQRLEGTIHIQKTTSLSQREFCTLLQRWKQRLQGGDGKRSKLTLEGLPNAFKSHGYTKREMNSLLKQFQLNDEPPIPPLTGVQKVVLINSQPQYLVTPVGPFISQLFPNLLELDVRSVDMPNTNVFQTYAQSCPNLRTIRYAAAPAAARPATTDFVGCCGIDVAANCLSQMRSLRELHLDRGSSLILTGEFALHVPRLANARTRHLLRAVRRQLERVSLPNCTVAALLGNISDRQQQQQQQSHKYLRLHQSALVEFVRRAPRLRWFCSDLNDANRKQLELERPDVTFVSSSSSPSYSSSST